MKKFLIIIAILILYSASFAQENQRTYSEWYYKPSVGINIPASNMLSGEITDNLIGYDDNSVYWQFISANYFFSPKWGIEFAFQANTSSRFSKKIDQLNNELNNEFGNKNYINTNTGTRYDRFNIIGGNIEKGFLGVVYRYETPKIVILPKMLIGVTSFHSTYGIIYLKEKNTNNISQLSYDPKTYTNNYFTLAPSLTFGYRLSERILANIDFTYSFYQTNIEYTKEHTNLFTQNKTTENISYKKGISTISVGAGIIIELRKVYY